MNPPRKRKILTTQEKQKLLDNFTISPLSSKKFAIQNGIGHSTLMRWRRESNVANCNPTNLPSTLDTENLFFECILLRIVNGANYGNVNTQNY